MARDFIMSLIVRPGRVVSPAAVGEVFSGKIGPDVEAATDAETGLFISRRLSANRPVSDRDLGGPVSQTVVLEVLKAATASQATFAAMESRNIEFKERLPDSKQEAAAIARTMAAFANTGGGYLVFGIRDNRTPAGIFGEHFSAACDRVSDIATNCFSPAIGWDKGLVNFGEFQLGVIYAYEAPAKPVVAMADSNGIDKSMIYFRYEGKTQRIEPGDLLHMIHERAAAAAGAPRSTEFHI